MFCRHCGNKLPDGAKFCNHCGNAVLDADTSTIRKETAPAVPPDNPQPSVDANMQQPSSQDISPPQFEPPEPSQEYNVASQSISKHKGKRSQAIGIVCGIALVVLLIAAIAGFFYIRSEYPELTKEMDLNSLTAASMTTTLSVGQSATVTNDPRVPVEITFVGCAAEPAADGIQVTVSIKVQNIRSKVWHFDKAEFIAYADDSLVSSEWESLAVALGRYESETINLTYEVPYGTSSTTLEYHDKMLFGTALIVKMSTSLEPLLAVSIPDVNRTVDPTEFVGQYSCVDDTSELLYVFWDDFLLEFGCYGYRTTYFDCVQTYPYENDPYVHFDGNSVRLNAQTALTDGFLYDITFTYVPEEFSPYGADTIYMQSDDFKNAIYTRTPDSFRYVEMPSDPGEDYYGDELESTPIVSEEDFPKLLSTYNGLHIEPHVPYDDNEVFTEGYGHVEVEIYLTAIDESTMCVELTVTSHSDSGRVAEVFVSGTTTPEPSLWATYEDDGWGNSGEVYIYFLENGRIGVMSEIFEWGDNALWGVDLAYTELPSVTESQNYLDY